MQQKPSKPVGFEWQSNDSNYARYAKKYRREGPALPKLHVNGRANSAINVPKRGIKKPEPKVSQPQTLSFSPENPVSQTFSQGAVISDMVQPSQTAPKKQLTLEQIEAQHRVTPIKTEINQSNNSAPMPQQPISAPMYNQPPRNSEFVQNSQYQSPVSNNLPSPIQPPVLPKVEEPDPADSSKDNHTEISKEEIEFEATPSKISNFNPSPKAPGTADMSKFGAVSSKEVAENYFNNNPETKADKPVVESPLNGFFEKIKSFLNKNKNAQNGLKILAILVLGAAGYIGFDTLQTNNQVKDQLSNVSVQTAHAAPVTDKSNVAPTSLKIESLKINAPIEILAENNKGEVAAPQNVNNVGWYSKSSQPGKGGIVFIDGHTGTQSLPAVFDNLKDIKSGDKIEIQRADKLKAIYKVKSIENISLEKINMQNLLTSSAKESEKLILMTCAGDYNQAKETYDYRTIVTAHIAE